MDTTNLFIKLSLFLLCINVYPSFPQIDSSGKSAIFRQFETDVKENRRRLSIGQDILPVVFFSYKIQEDDNIFSVSAKFNLNYDTLTTLNEIENQLFFRKDQSILIPNCPGIFTTDIQNSNTKIIDLSHIKDGLFFYPGKTLDSKDRLAFLTTPFIHPLKNMKLTSEYGYRENPFTGFMEIHPGIDLRASLGTKVYSTYDGIIESIEYSNFYGLILVLNHGYGYSSKYFHLEKVIKKVGDKVIKNQIIAYTGNTGKSTGPHLHFEIRKDGEPVNPVKLLPRF